MSHLSLMIQRKVFIKGTAKANNAQLCENKRQTEQGLDSGVSVRALPRGRAAQGRKEETEAESHCLACMVTVHLSPSCQHRQLVLLPCFFPCAFHLKAFFVPNQSFRS